jgi:hypothetical protein
VLERALDALARLRGQNQSGDGWRRLTGRQVFTDNVNQETHLPVKARTMDTNQQMHAQLEAFPPREFAVQGL